MDEIDQYQTRIFAALDKVSRLTSGMAGKAPAPQGEGASPRDQSLIGELEATLAEERLELSAERDLVLALKDNLADAKNALDEAVAQKGGDGAFEAAALEAQEARQSLEAQLETALAQIDTAKSEADRNVQQQEKDQERQQNTTSHLEETVARLTARIENQDVQFQRLKGANAQLRDSNALLRERNVEMLGDASAVDQSMQAELEALKATRAADVEEMTTILDELKPLVKEQANG